METDEHTPLPHPAPGPGEPEQSHKGTELSVNPFSAEGFSRFLSNAKEAFTPKKSDNKSYNQMGLGPNR
jgi:hypothetical protein